MDGRRRGQGHDMVQESSTCIARETSESAYSWDSEGDGKTEIFGFGNSVEYIKC